jgi:3-oxoacyl-(acyl-carrier-protein) synthase/3-hydroxymyristoyl/3-hydroxydecanoyl-(acyl carrier protein) dehydratase
MSFSPVAIVGRGCVLPGASTPEALGDLSAAGASAIACTPAGRWGIADRRILRRPEISGPDTTWSNRGGYVTQDVNLDDIDPAQLGRAFPHARERGVEGLDPVFRWLLRAGRDALVDARMEAGGPRIGAVVGNLSFPTAGMARVLEASWLRSAGAFPSAGDPGDPRNRFMSGLPAHALARALDLGAGAFALDAACASALVAIEIACARLNRGEVDAMLAGAVNAADDLFLHMGFRALGALSRSGRSRPFHAQADGLVPAEGAALVALKRLDDARRDGDAIHGVIVGIGTSNDGRGRGLLVPSSAGQVRALRAAYADIDPATVSWLECHATGTQVGDGVEIASTREVFGDRALALGSLKANLGHLITAAGAAGLLRVLEAMRRDRLPPTPNVDEPLGALDDSGYLVLQQERPWPREAGPGEPGPRRAGVSAFGFGGNNAHLVVEQYEDRPVQVALPGPSKAPPAPIAVVALDLRVGALDGVAAFASALFDGTHALRHGAPGIDEDCGWAESVTLPLAGIRFPPNALQETLPQQLLLLQLARRATAGLAQPLDSERSSVFVGMGCDVAVARHGARWRSAEWAHRWGADGAWLEQTREAFAPLLGSAGVLGCMPNICANRLNSQLDLQGPSATIASEELSGVRAVAVARRMLEDRQIDTALVAAVDVAAEPGHRQALSALDPAAIPVGDAAVMLVLMRLQDAERRGEQVLAVFEEPTEEHSPCADVDARFGRAHAASGLVAVAAAISACAYGFRAKDEPGRREPWSERRASLTLDALGGERESLALRGPGRTLPLPEPLVPVDGPSLTLGVHAPVVRLPPLTGHDLAPAPALRAPRSPPSGDPAARPPARDSFVATMERHGQRLLERHQSYLATQAAAFEDYRAHSASLLRSFIGAPDAPPRNTAQLPRSEPPGPSAPVPHAAPATAFDRRALEIHASGRISEIFGPEFEQQDGHAVQVRMPERRLLLCDRVTAIDAERAVLGEGTVWTETDVEDDSWYLHHGHMPAGLMIEAGQADLFLISYMGIDFFNRGERAYRLLGCDVTYGRGLPTRGETLRYDIHVDGHAQQGDVRLFFFHYDCRIGDEIVLSVRNGQAGFFSDAELADSDGVIWSAETQAIDEHARLDPPKVIPTARDFGPDAIAAFASGDLFGCFGAGFEMGQAHVRTPTIQPGQMCFIDRVEGFDPKGGPWGRGHLLARKAIAPDMWFFDGHFKNDPCMPGTLMLEGCLQMMAFYLAAMGYTLERDGWRFEPVLEHSVNLRCRGQVLPNDDELICEIFVEEVHDGPYPTIYADLLGTVNGLKAFHARRMGLRLVPSWPVTSQPALPHELGDVAEADGFRFDYRSLLACAWGKPSQAFGPMYAPFDDLRRVPRLPGPPYHFMSRVRSVSGPIGGMEVGSSATIEYDVPADAWYFGTPSKSDSGARVMPFAILLEAVLQPCGWLASYVGSARTTEQDLCFRNLDGDGVVHIDVTPDTERLVTTTTLTNISQTAGMIIQSFDVTCMALRSDGQELVYALKTVFGFFPHAALENQVGLPTTDAQRDQIGRASGEGLPRSVASFRGQRQDGPRLAGPMLMMLDRIVALDETGGDHGLGWIVADKDVDPGEWFFKAHFFQDPVQPGSLGLEALLQLLQLFMLETFGDALAGGRFEAIRLGSATSWKYRGQVVPRNRVIRTSATITERGPDFVVADASLWVDDKRIYHAKNLGMRIVRDGDG